MANPSSPPSFTTTTTTTTYPLLLHSTMTQLDQLPSEILLEICPFLADCDIAQLATTCQSLHRVTYEYWSWHRKFVGRFGAELLKHMVQELNKQRLEKDENVDMPTTLPSSLIRSWIDHHGMWQLESLLFYCCKNFPLFLLSLTRVDPIRI